jgi:hypothetical protein
MAGAWLPAKKLTEKLDLRGRRKCRLFCVWAGFLLVKGTPLGFSFLSGNEQQTGAQTYP